MIYLKRKNVEKLMLANIRPYRAFIGGIVISMVITYAASITLALLGL